MKTIVILTICVLLAASTVDARHHSSKKSHPPQSPSWFVPKASRFSRVILPSNINVRRVRYSANFEITIECIDLQENPVECTSDDFKASAELGTLTWMHRIGKKLMVRYDAPDNFPAGWTALVKDRIVFQSDGAFLKGAPITLTLLGTPSGINTQLTCPYTTLRVGESMDCTVAVKNFNDHITNSLGADFDTHTKNGVKLILNPLNVIRTAYSFEYTMPNVPTDTIVCNVIQSGEPIRGAPLKINRAVELITDGNFGLGSVFSQWKVEQNGGGKLTLNLDSNSYTPFSQSLRITVIAPSTTTNYALQAKYTGLAFTNGRKYNIRFAYLCSSASAKMTAYAQADGGAYTAIGFSKGLTCSTTWTWVDEDFTSYLDTTIGKLAWFVGNNPAGTSFLVDNLSLVGL